MVRISRHAHLLHSTGRGNPNAAHTPTTNNHPIDRYNQLPSNNEPRKPNEIMKITALALLFGCMTAMTTGAAFVFPARQSSSLVPSHGQRFASASARPPKSSLFMSTLDKASTKPSKVKDASETMHCIPLDEISLSDLPKVGG